jgi:hypothetical protein
MYQEYQTEAERNNHPPLRKIIFGLKVLQVLQSTEKPYKGGTTVSPLKYLISL